MIIQQLIQTRLFHLISMLLCICVIVWLLVQHYFRSERENQKDRVRLLNTLYISGILAFIIIELVTSLCMENTKYADILSFVSFAATLSSLILSVVAIIFTIVFSNRGEMQYQKLDKVSDEVKASLSSFTEKTESIDSSVDRFRDLTNSLSEQIHDVYDKLSRLEKPIFEMKDSMLLSDGIIVDNKKKNGNLEDDFSIRVSNFVSVGSFSGNLALLACTLSKETNRSFRMSEIGENDDDEAYKFGYIMASNAMGIIKAEVTGERNIKLLFCFEGLKDILLPSLQRFISGTQDAVSKRSNQQRLDRIMELFKSA